MEMGTYHKGYVIPDAGDRKFPLKHKGKGREFERGPRGAPVFCDAKVSREPNEEERILFEIGKNGNVKRWGPGDLYARVSRGN